MAHTKLRAMVVIFAALIPFSVGLADWNVGDPAVYSQLPNPNGWDVYSEWGTGPYSNQGYGAANDWTATTTCNITDIHFWGSWKDDHIGQTGKILIQIFSNDTMSDPGKFARPDELLWSDVINVNEYTSRLYTTGVQGWYDPRGTDTWQANNHVQMWQYNIPVLETPFQQVAGQTYWIMISMDFQGCEWGWKTTNSVAGNSSVFWDKSDVWGPHCNWYRDPGVSWKWTELQTPNGYCYPRNPVDLAFVLTPEPATLSLLAIGAAALLRRRRN
jgi:hypothetical protein